MSVHNSWCVFCSWVNIWPSCERQKVKFSRNQQFFQFPKSISRNKTEKWNSYQRLLPSILNRMTFCFGILMEYLWCIAFRKGITSPSPEKSPEGKLGQWPTLPSDQVCPVCIGKSKEALETGLCEKWATYSVSGPQDPPPPQKNANLTTIGKYGVGQGQWPQMTFERSRCNFTAQMWSSLDLNHA